MLKKPLISIITPTYNHEEYIEKCINSVLAQEYTNWEQIVIDDGSTDNTGNIITDFDDIRIKYIKQNNLGIYSLKETYNKALKLSKGEYIAILEGDDYWPSYKLEKQIKVFQNPGVIWSCGNTQMVKDDGEILGLVNKKNSIPKISSNYETLDRLLLKNFVPACTVLCKKSALLNIGGFQQPQNSPCVDYPTWLHLSKLGNFYYEDDIMGYWRKHEGQASSLNAFEMYKYNTEYVINFFNDLSEEDKKLLTTNIDIMIKSKSQMLANLDFDVGMRYLYNKEWEYSRKSFKSALKGTSLTKFYAIIGIICSFFKIDMKILVSILQKNK